jgi:hypothetical protein
MVPLLRLITQWSHQMSFKKISSRMEKAIFFNGFSRQDKSKFFRISCQSFIRVQKRIQNPPWEQCQNVITQDLGWENPNPTTIW